MTAGTGTAEVDQAQARSYQCGYAAPRRGANTKNGLARVPRVPLGWRVGTNETRGRRLAHYKLKARLRLSAVSSSQTSSNTQTPAACAAASSFNFRSSIAGSKGIQREHVFPR